MAKKIVDDFPDDAVFSLTEQACMQTVLEDFGIEVSLTMAKAIVNEFMDLMVRQGYIGGNENG